MTDDIDGLGPVMKPKIESGGRIVYECGECGHKAERQRREVVFCQTDAHLKQAARSGALYAAKHLLVVLGMALLAFAVVWVVFGG